MLTLNDIIRVAKLERTYGERSDHRSKCGCSCRRHKKTNVTVPQKTIERTKTHALRNKSE